MGLSSADHIKITEEFCAHNYHPLNVVIAKGEGVWVWDVEGNKYLDMLSAYSALNFGHRNPRFIQAAIKQMEEVPLTCRAFYNDQLGLFSKELAELCGMEMVLPMNSGSEAIETAIKACRRWGYEKKGVYPDSAEIICFHKNFGGRTVTIISFSDSQDTRRSYGPYTPGFHIARFGDLNSVKSLITQSTVGILIEPIQGEGGINIPPKGFMRALRDLCTRQRILFIADEVQTGFGRTGDLFACDYEKIKPDMYVLGKSLGGGIMPLSAVVAKKEILDVFEPGSHGSTFGGNPLACAIGREVIAYIKEERPWERARELGNYFLVRLKTIKSARIKEVRGRGLMIGIDIHSAAGSAWSYCEKLKDLGILTKDTRKQVIRFAPPLIITKDELDWAFERIDKVFRE